MGVRGSGEGKCEGKKATLTLTLTPFITVCQPVTAKSEGVRVKNKKTFSTVQLETVSVNNVSNPIQIWINTACLCKNKQMEHR